MIPASSLVYKEAEKEKKIEIARGLLQTELSIEVITQHTGLTVAQIQELRTKDSFETE